MKNRKKRYGKEEKREKEIAMKVSGRSICINLLLSLFKLAAGLAAGSDAMITDSVHSASDVFSTVVVMIGVTAASKKSDKEHPYGHERMECVASVLLSAVLFVTGMAIGIRALEKIVQGGGKALAAPGKLALAAAVVSVLVKEWMYWYTRAAAKKTRSGALMADAWHHRSDALSSVGAFAGIFGARLGYPVLDPVASLAICLFIGKAAADIFKDAMDKMVDKSCDDDVVARMREAALEEEGVLRVDEIRTRMFGSKVYVDIEIAADSGIPLGEAHEIAEQVHGCIEGRFPQVKHCMVHVNPVKMEEETD